MYLFLRTLLSTCSKTRKLDEIRTPGNVKNSDSVKGPSRRQRKEGAALADLALKILRYRGDLIPDRKVELIEGKLAELRSLLRDHRVHAGRELTDAMRGLELLLRPYGGTIYPKTFWGENTEVFLVTALVVLAIRTFFFQPFIIPTNSMYPSFYGLTATEWTQAEERPAVWTRPVRFLLQGARDRTVRSEEGGAVYIAFDQNGLHREMVRSRRWIVLPSLAAAYPIRVGDEVSWVRVPPDFDFPSLLLEAFFPEAADFGEVYERAAREGRLRQDGGLTFLDTGQRVSPGEIALGFTIYSGDALFVDRMSYHFVKPKPGDPFVFRTEPIARIAEEKYYIKRLVGVGGDRIAIRPPQLLRNGTPIEGAVAFAKNFAREDGFPGYRYGGELGPGASVLIPEGHFYALGDNSANSADSRMFGSVPPEAVVGRALWIYYPFTSRWGRAR